MEETTAPSRLGSCEICASKAAKYTCPRCEIKSCSLSCSKIHKTEVQCNGERDRTKFITLNKFTNLDLASDYRLLEEISRSVETAKRKKISHHSKLRRRFLRLKIEAQSRDITLKYLPEHFNKHKNNSSWYNIEKNLIEWRIDLIFINTNLTIKEERVSELLKLSTILNKYMIKQENCELQEKLQYYQAVDLIGIKILMQAERRSGRKFYDIDPTLTLKETLKNKLIIEYPVFHIVLKDHIHLYDVLDSDDESGMKIKKELKSGNEVIDEIVNRSELENNTNKPLKNLLFTTDITDDSSDDD